MERKCKLCGKTGDLFTLDVPTDDPNLKHSVFVCGTCWDVIAEIALRAVKALLNK